MVVETINNPLFGVLCLCAVLLIPAILKIGNAIKWDKFEKGLHRYYKENK